MAKKNILIIEDHALTRFGLRTAFKLNSDDEDFNFTGKIFEAPNAKKGIETIEKEKIDVVIMDLGLPDMNGIEATKIIKSKHPGIKVVVLSSHEQEEDVIKAIKAGASAYCTKDIDQEKLVYIIASVVKGAAWFDPKIAQYVLNAAGSPLPSEKQKQKTEHSLKNEPAQTNDINLTVREKQVLSLIVEGLNNAEISKKLDVSINTTKAHVCNILQKLAVADRTQAAIKAIKDNII